mmetsp:Transcript_10219/g.39757  ORF Transcript_10219/g.39757 Transcript_10219/m.39757 type:complete len:352 (+) Transcript_10219:1601-2656(+)
MTPPQTTMTSSASSALSAATSCGTRVLWPAAWLLTPTTCTSASTASRATSSGVWNSGPTSTSKPMSAKPEAITLAPRSWPSWPILATMMRGRRPSSSTNASTTRCTWLSSSSPSALYSCLYAPCTTSVRGVCRPHTDSRASLISPRVQRARAASMASFMRFCGCDPEPVDSVNAALSARAARAALAAASSRDALMARRRSTCLVRTEVLSIDRTSTPSSFSRRYLLTPTMTSALASMRACLRAAASSMRSLGMPLSMALAMPPSSSTSSMRARAESTSSFVSDSIMYEPPHGSTTLVMPVSSWSTSWVLRAMRAENSVGRPSASSNELVCRDWVPPMTAAMPSTAVRTTLL